MHKKIGGRGAERIMRPENICFRGKYMVSPIWEKREEMVLIGCDCVPSRCKNLGIRENMERGD